MAEEVQRLGVQTAWHVEEYCWLLRLQGKAPEALRVLDSYLFKNPACTGRR